MWPFQRRRLQAAGERSWPPCTKTHCTSPAGSSSLRQRLAGGVSHLFNLTRGFSKNQHKVALFKKNDCPGNLLIKLLSYGSIKSKLPMRSLQAEKSNKGWNLNNPESAIQSSRPFCQDWVKAARSSLYWPLFCIFCYLLSHWQPCAIMTHSWSLRIEPLSAGVPCAVSTSPAETLSTQMWPYY